MVDQVKKILVVVDSKGIPGLKKIATEFNALNATVKKATGIFEGLQTAFKAVVGFSFLGVGLRGVTSLIDSMQLLQSRIGIINGGSEDAAVTLGKVAQVANNTAASVEDLATIYARLGFALSETGIKGNALLGLTQALQNSFKLYGASAAEATGATLQLSQGLAAGQLRGQELRSTLEADAIVGKILADSLGVRRGNLLKFAAERGGITEVEFFTAMGEGAEKLNEQAKKMALTMSQTVTVALNDVKVKINELNNSFKITKKFQDLVFFIKDNIPLVFSGFIGFLVALKLEFIAATAATFGFRLALANTAYFLLYTFPQVAALTIAFGALTMAVVDNDQFMARLFRTMAQVKYVVLEVVNGFNELGLKLYKLTGSKVLIDQMTKSISEMKKEQVLLNGVIQTTNKQLDTSAKGFDFTKDFVDQAKKLKKGLGTANLDTVGKLNIALREKLINDTQYLAKLKDIQLTDLNKSFYDVGTSMTKDEYNKKKQEILFGKIKKTREGLFFLNKEFGESGNLDEYQKRLDDLALTKLHKDFKDGTINLIQFNEEIKNNKLLEYQKAVNAGKMSLEDFAKSTDALNIDTLNREFRNGTKDLLAYNEALIKMESHFSPGAAIYVGTESYIRSIGTLSEQIAGSITTVFSALETSLANALIKGKFDFKDFSDVIMVEIARIAVRMAVLKPLGLAVEGVFSGGPSQPSGTKTTTASFTAAPGELFARGGVVSGTTAFKHSGGLGIMGEKGPEAIMPLRRNAQGDLGVKSTPANVYVNVTNQTSGGAEVQRQERTNSNGEKIIDILIINKVKEAFGQGHFDKQFSSQYGLRRKGA